MITYEIKDGELLRVIRTIIQRAENPRPLMVGIGELLVDSTKQRFRTSTAPDGERWVGNSETTILNFLSRYRSSFRKDGRLRKSGAARAAAKKPLIGESRRLSTTIAYRAARDSVSVGSPLPQAAMMHFGGSKADYPHLWGDIPARNFLGLSSNDEDGILDLVEDFLTI